MKCLVPVDGSECSRRAVEHMIAMARSGTTPEIHLIHVSPPVADWEVRSFLKDAEIADLQRQEGEAELAPARALLDSAGLVFSAQVAAGPIAQTIARYADELSCDCIVMGTQGRGGLSQILTGSVAAEVVHLTHVPVTLVK
jgi:nucleotide-binding universal stress UspA family protein